ncbi:MAG: DUF1178 family protein [Pigmentiphaga sp.]|nr:DUF1178 family protein [Pigmentiphaga sp.]
MAFKVFDLQCELQHVFEAWFSSHDDFHAQQEKGMISCPLCGSSQVEKKLSSPRLNLSGSSASVASRQQKPSAQTAQAEPAALQAEAFRQLRAYINASENVGDRFVDEARKIHLGDAPERAIRGTANEEERRSLAEDGIQVAPIPDWLNDEKLQ